MIESTRRAWILASSEILEELQKGWSQPVQVRASENPDGSWDMTVRTCSGLQEVAELARLLNETAEIPVRDNPHDFLGPALVRASVMTKLRDALLGIEPRP